MESFSNQNAGCRVMQTCCANFFDNEERGCGARWMDVRLGMGVWVVIGLGKGEWRGMVEQWLREGWGAGEEVIEPFEAKIEGGCSGRKRGTRC